MSQYPFRPLLHQEFSNSVQDCPFLHKSNLTINRMYVILFFQSPLMETKTIKFQLEDSNSRDIIDLELYERVPVRTLKRIISNTHPDHPNVERISMDYSDDQMLPAEANENIVCCSSFLLELGNGVSICNIFNSS